MRHRTLLVLTALSLIMTLTSGPTWGQIGYAFKGSEKSLQEPPPKRPNSGVVFVDAAIGRPLGLATTIVGTTLFVLTLPFTAPSGSAGEAAHALVVQPGGWTFVRPLGRSDPRYEDRGVFKVTEY